MISGSIPVWLIRVNSIVYAKLLTECPLNALKRLVMRIKSN